MASTPKSGTDKNSNVLTKPHESLVTEPECETDSGILAPDEVLKNIIKFAKENNLKYKRNKTFCKVCNIKISSSFKKLKEHVAEQGHKDKVEAVKTAEETASRVTSARAMKNNSKILMSEFIISKTNVRSIFSHDIVINDKYYMSAASFETISTQGARRSCLTCQVLMNPPDVTSHLCSEMHQQQSERAYVLTEFDSEFVREVRPGVYHCGFCNFIEGSMDGLKNHLKSINHVAKKAYARRQLNDHMVVIMELREEYFNRLILRDMMNLLV